MLKLVKLAARTGLALSLFGLALAPLPGYAVGGGNTPMTRMDGNNRQNTAIGMCEEMYPTAGTADHLVLVAKDNYADAVVAGPFAAMKGACVLLTGKDSLDADTADEILRVLKVDSSTSPDVYAIGGDQVLSQDVIDAVAALRSDIIVERISGATRLHTGVAVAEKMDQIRGEGPKWVFITDGYSFADSVASAGVGANNTVCPGYMPILLVTKDDLPQVVEDYLRANAIVVTTGTPPTPKIEKAFVVGGEARVSQAVYDEIDTIVDQMERIAGDTRYDTAAALAERFYGSGNPPTKFAAARGDEWADSLSAAPFIGKKKMPLLLVKPDELVGETASYLTTYASTITTGYVIGGTLAVSDAVKAAMEAIYMAL